MRRGVFQGGDVGSRRHLCGAVLGCLLTGVAFGAEPGFVPLFNGRDLSGWTGRPDTCAVDPKTKSFTFKKGQARTIYTERVYTNYVLRFEFKLTPNANNGIGVHFPGGNANGTVDGKCELQILDDSGSDYADLKPYQFHGSIYGIHPARRDNPAYPRGSYLKPVGKWNAQEVRVDGGRITVTLNGVVIQDVDTTALHPPFADTYAHEGFSRTCGHIALLGHPGDAVSFRNIRVREL